MISSLKRKLCILFFIGMFAIGTSALLNMFVDNKAKELVGRPETIETALTKYTPFRHAYHLPQYGLNALLNRRYYPDHNVFILDNGQQVLGQKQYSMNEAAANTAQFAEFCENNEINFFYVVCPCKPSSNEENGIIDIPFYANENADAFIELATRKGIHVLDLRPEYQDDFYKWYYRTDHHWTAEAGLQAARCIVEELNNNYGYHLDENLLDTTRFKRTVIPQCYVGETGMRTLGPFCPKDDYVLVEPSYDVHFHYIDPEPGIDRTGSFDVVFDTSKLHDMAIRNISLYYYYLEGNYSRSEIINRNAEEGNILLIKDSYSNVVTPFLALSCNHVTTWDMRFDSGLFDYIEQHPDIETVIIMHAPGQIKNEKNYNFQ